MDGTTRHYHFIYSMALMLCLQCLVQAGARRMRHPTSLPALQEKNSVSYLSVAACLPTRACVRSPQYRTGVPTMYTRRQTAKTTNLDVLERLHVDVLCLAQLAPQLLPLLLQPEHVLPLPRYLELKGEALDDLRRQRRSTCSASLLEQDLVGVPKLQILLLPPQRSIYLLTY